MFASVPLVFATAAAGVYAVTLIDRLFRDLAQNQAVLNRQRDTHANHAMKEDVGFLAVRILLQARDNSDFLAAWANQIINITGEALPGPNAYNPDRPSGIIQ